MQYTNPYTGRTFNNPMSSTLDTWILHSMQRRMMYSTMLRKKGYTSARLNKMSTAQMQAVLGLKGSSGKVAAATTQKSAPALPPATKFKPGPKRLLLDTFANGLGTTITERDAYRTIFSEVFKAFEAEAKKQKLDNDIVAAMAFNIATHYSLYRPGTNVSDVAVKALVSQLHSAMESYGLRKASNPDKQKVYEVFLLLAAYSIAIAQVAEQQPDPKIKKAAQVLAGEGLRYVLKVDPAKVNISDNGLELT